MNLPQIASRLRDPMSLLGENLSGLRPLDISESGVVNLPTEGQ